MNFPPSLSKSETNSPKPQKVQYWHKGSVRIFNLLVSPLWSKGTENCRNSKKGPFNPSAIVDGFKNHLYKIDVLHRTNWIHANGAPVAWKGDNNSWQIVHEYSMEQIIFMHCHSYVCCLLASFVYVWKEFWRIRIKVCSVERCNLVVVLLYLLKTQ